MNGFGRGNDPEKKHSALFSRETVGMTLLLFGAVALFIAVTGRAVFGDIGVAITAFFVGVFGFLAYPLLVLLIYASVVLVTGKKFLPGAWLLRGGLLVLAAFFLVHIATAEQYFIDPATGAACGYGAYLGGCWTGATESLASGTGGGVVMGLIAYPVRFVLSAAGAYVLACVLILFTLWFMLLLTPLRRVLLPSARSRARERERKSGDEGVSFEDLRTPERGAAPQGTPYGNNPYGGNPYGQAPYGGNPYAQTPYGGSPYGNPYGQPYQPQTGEPAPRGVSAPEPPAEPAAPAQPLTSRDILFGPNAAADYRKNLIFDRDSYFGNGRRARGGDPAPSDGGPVREGPAPSETRYGESYGRAAETARPQMPRRVTATPVDDYDPAGDDVNYMQQPSYRAPTPEPAQPFEPSGSDFGISSEPNLADYRLDTPAEPETLPAEPETPAEPLPRGDRAEPREPAATDRPMGFGRDFGSDLPEPPRTPEEPSEPRRGFGRDFGSDLPEPTRTPEEPSEPRRGFGRDSGEGPRTFDSDFGRDEPARREEYDLGGESNADLFDEGDYRETPAEPLPRERGERSRGERGLRETAPRPAGPAVPAPRIPEPEPEPRAQEPAKPEKIQYAEYIRPSFGHFQNYNDSVSIDSETIERNSAIIIDTLRNFNVDADIVKVTCGAAFTRYDIDIPGNVPVSKVVKRDAEIALRLHSRDGVTVSSNSESGTISIDVPNLKRATVGIRSVLNCDEYVNAKPGALVFAMGKDVEGRPVCGNIVKMKHLLVAGSTGSGKSVCLNAMLVSLLCKYSPEELRLILIDPKMVEFAIFEGIPHLMINEIVTDPQKAIMALNWAIKEMNHRYELFAQKTRSGKNVQNIDQYNEIISEDENKLCKIVIVVDELADLMLTAKKDIEDRILKIAQKARAAGIHLVLATQRPDVNIITGTIKSNLPTRIAFRTIQDVDSRTILDENGAEKLLGNGDMLYRSEGMFSCKRVQGAFLSAGEVQAIIDDIKQNNPQSYFDDSVADYINGGGQESGGGTDGDSRDGEDGADDQYVKALGIVVKLGQASISLIQRKCSVGYNHAGKIIEWMELMGYISPFDGKAKARTVLLTKEEYEEKYGRLD